MDKTSDAGSGKPFDQAKAIELIRILSLRGRRLSLHGLAKQLGQLSRSPPHHPTYDPISPKGHIRILLLHQGKFHDPIRADLTVVNLSDKPSFDAVSYCWADEFRNATKCCEAFINGSIVPFPITRNCQAALRRIRKTDQVTRLWIDAICINQDNSKEKGHQVDLMPQIYSSARRTYVFLGEGEAGAEGLDKLSKGRDRREWDFFQLPYFSRIWILQEIALSKDLRAIFGATEVPYSSTFTRDRMLTMFGSPITVALLPSAILLHEDDRFRGSASLLQGLQLGRPCKATKAEDKVFGVLGMVHPQQRHGLYADYESGVTDVYVRAAKQLIENDGGSLRSVLGSIICNMTIAGTFGKETPGPYDLPSWVPDWRQQRELTRMCGWTFEERLINWYPGSKKEPNRTYEPMLDIPARFSIHPYFLQLDGQFLGALTELRRWFEYRVWFFDERHFKPFDTSPPHNSEIIGEPNWSIVAFKVQNHQKAIEDRVMIENKHSLSVVDTYALLLYGNFEDFWLKTQLLGNTGKESDGCSREATISVEWIRGRPPAATDSSGSQPMDRQDQNSGVDTTDERNSIRWFKLLGLMCLSGPAINITGKGGDLQEISIS
ncbi:hypothetical protein N8I77_010904 [Diaporthe amygdali]|uniref:Heterokaryon incompatibility domain-containing protein n=1 Tax=Phomopsis amygdali TaxID=1214568 RepID=A0AAD9S9H9_PHOAM|nr:hypothetical protein N8I77_010904 [Diaporthe amygdali]